MEKLDVQICEDGILAIEGIRCTLTCIRDFARNADGSLLYAFKREGDVMHVRTFHDGDAAKEYLDALAPSVPA